MSLTTFFTVAAIAFVCASIAAMIMNHDAQDKL